MDDLLWGDDEDFPAVYNQFDNAITTEDVFGVGFFEDQEIEDTVYEDPWDRYPDNHWDSYPDVDMRDFDPDYKLSEDDLMKEYRTVVTPGLIVDWERAQRLKDIAQENGYEKFNNANQPGNYKDAMKIAYDAMEVHQQMFRDEELKNEWNDKNVISSLNVYREQQNTNSSYASEAKTFFQQYQNEILIGASSLAIAGSTISFATRKKKVIT